jgi:hypothetical protein
MKDIFAEGGVSLARLQSLEKVVIGAGCTSFPQAVDLAAVAGWAVFVPGYWWQREKNWVARTQNLPGLETYQRGFQLGWNR